MTTAALFQTIRNLGNAASEHHFCGSFEGCAAVIFDATPGHALGTHWVALVHPEGVHQWPVATREECGRIYWAIINAIHTQQNRAAA